MRKAVLWGGVLVMAAAAGSAVWLALEFDRPYQGYPGRSLKIVIPRGHAIARIAETLESRGVVRSASLFRWYARLTGVSTDLKAGEYLFEGPHSIASVCRQLSEGRVHFYRITIPEGLTMDEIVERFLDRGLGSRNGFTTALERIDLVRDLDPRAANLEGYLFPETYTLTRETTEVEIIQAMVENFRQAWTVERARRARELEMSVRQVVTLASLIEKETARADERPLISGVFHNRLRRDLPLACDPTVIYAVKLIKEYDGIIHQSDLRLDSPYNTYLYPGLPPGPIANAGLDSLESALWPADTDYLYFVSKNDGSHHFSRSYREHARAVRDYQR